MVFTPAQIFKHPGLNPWNAATCAAQAAHKSSGITSKARSIVDDERKLVISGCLVERKLSRALEPFPQRAWRQELNLNPALNLPNRAVPSHSTGIFPSSSTEANAFQ